jgi:hypothetical protein
VVGSLSGVVVVVTPNNVVEAHPIRSSTLSRRCETSQRTQARANAHPVLSLVESGYRRWLCDLMEDPFLPMEMCNTAAVTDMCACVGGGPQGIHVHEDTRCTFFCVFVKPLCTVGWSSSCFCCLYLRQLGRVQAVSANAEPWFLHNECRCGPVRRPSRV